MDHHGIAKRYLDEANDHYKLAHTNPNTSASLATAHAVLALIDYLQQDDTDDDQQLKLERTEAELLRMQNRYRHLEEDLEGARAALRARDDELNTEMKAAQESRNG